MKCLINSNGYTNTINGVEYTKYHIRQLRPLRNGKVAAYGQSQALFIMGDVRDSVFKGDGIEASFDKVFQLSDTVAIIPQENFKSFAIDLEAPVQRSEPAWKLADAKVTDLRTKPAEAVEDDAEDF